MKPFAGLLYLLFFSNLFVTAQDKYSSVKIFAPADKQLRSSIIAELEIDHYQLSSDGAMIVEIGSRELARLHSGRYRYEILVDDLVENLQNVNRQYFESGSHTLQQRMAIEQTGSTVDQLIAVPENFEIKPVFGGYYSFAEMESVITALVNDYPQLVSRIAIGTSHEGRTIWCIKISDNVDVDEATEPEVLFIGLQHAREAIGGASMIYFMQYLCEFYSKDSRIKQLVDQREIFIIPCMNPDGWEYNRLNGGAGSGWRKNRRNNPGSDEGVDLNRNWGVDWANCAAPIQGNAGSCGSNSYASGTYYGPSAFSEPETRAIRDFTYTRNFVAMIDQHAFGPYYSLPFGRPSLSTNVMSSADQLFYTHLASAMGTYNGMRAGNSYEALDYEVAGGVKDWMLKGNIGTGTKGKIMGFTGEGGAGGGTGGANGSFWPPASQIIPLCKGMVYQNLQLLYASGTYGDLQDLSDINVNTRNGDFSFSYTRTGLGNQPVTISFIPIENIQSGGDNIEIAGITNYGDSYQGQISYTLPSSLAAGQRIKFAWKVDTDGISWTDTITKYFQAEELFFDDMEGDISTNWTGSWGLTAAGTGYGSGTSRAISESPAGNYPSSSTRTVRCLQTFDLSDATAASISLWARYRAENFRDKLQIQVSPDGVNWTAIVGTGTIQEPGTLDGSSINGQPSLTGIKTNWSRQIFDLSNYLGEPALQLRMVFSSGSQTSFAFSEDDGFYIDEVKVVKSNTVLVSLPVHFSEFTVRVINGPAVLLEWKATADADHSHFEIERSPDGRDFSAIALLEAEASTYTDRQPASGINYYRIKQWDFNGAYSYSKVIAVRISSPTSELKIFPNPVADQLSFRVPNAGDEGFTVTISDMLGRVVFKKSFQHAEGTPLKLPVANLSSQVYSVALYNKVGVVIAKEKFFKIK